MHIWQFNLQFWQWKSSFFNVALNIHLLKINRLNEKYSYNWLKWHGDWTNTTWMRLLWAKTTELKVLQHSWLGTQKLLGLSNDILWIHMAQVASKLPEVNFGGLRERWKTCGHARASKLLFWLKKWFLLGSFSKWLRKSKNDE